MKQYKFRGKCLKTGEWVYGGYAEKAADVGNFICECAIIPENCYPVEVDPDTVGQLTGLKDKNCADIYEGDVIIQRAEWSGEWVAGYYSDDSGEMEFRGVAGLIPSRGVILRNCKHRDLIESDEEWSKHSSIINVRGCRCEVVGNSHDSPELLND